MEPIGKVDARKLAAFVQGRAEYTRVFPGLLRVVGTKVESQLAARFPGIRGVVGEDVREQAKALLPQYGDHPPLDWVAFAFAGLRPWEVHVGVVWNFSTWPVTYRVGFHLGYDLMRAESRFRDLPWKELVGADVEFVDVRPMNEVQWDDPPRRPDLNRLDAVVAHIVGRAVRYYEAVAPHVAALRRELASRRGLRKASGRAGRARGRTRRP